MCVCVCVSFWPCCPVLSDDLLSCVVFWMLMCCWAIRLHILLPGEGQQWCSQLGSTFTHFFWVQCSQLQWEAGYNQVLFAVITSEDSRVSDQLKQSAAVQLKNVVSDGWYPSTDGTTPAITEEDKSFFAEHFAELLVGTHEHVRCAIAESLRWVAVVISGDND